jgi:inhibitor of cysteine peptidase
MASSTVRTGILCLALGLVAVACANKPGASEHAVEVTESDSGEHIELLEGQVLEVVLPENPSTGYHWTVEHLDDEVLEQLGRGSYTADPGHGGAIGAGGEVAIRFKGLRPGDTELILGNIPPGRERAEDTFELEVDVTEAEHGGGEGEAEH